MVDPRSARRLGHYAIFAAIAALTTFLRLLPVNPAPGRIPGPDLMVAFTFVWLMRRPDYVPALLIVAVFLFEDLIYWRPVGLWTLAMLGGTEFLRARVRPGRHMPLPVEIALVGAVTLTMLLGNRLILGLVMIEQPGLGPEMLRWLMTLVAYPFVVALSELAFGLRRPAPGESAVRHGA